jgi:RHS repeat-associated protein
LRSKISSIPVTDGYAYDGSGQRVWQQVVQQNLNGSSTTTSWVYVLGVAEQRTVTTTGPGGGTSTAVRTYLSAPGGVLLGRDTEGEREYLATDLLGTPIATLGLAGGVSGEQLRAPYGQPRYSASASGSASNNGMHTARGFTGQYEDRYTSGSSGLDYFNARYYDPVIGRFTSADTAHPGLGSPLGLDNYTYVGGRVETVTDPSGHWPGGFGPSWWWNLSNLFTNLLNAFLGPPYIPPTQAQIPTEQVAQYEGAQLPTTPSGVGTKFAEAWNSASSGDVPILGWGNTPPPPDTGGPTIEPPGPPDDCGPPQGGRNGFYGSGEGCNSGKRSGRGPGRGWSNQAGRKSGSQTNPPPTRYNPRNEKLQDLNDRGGPETYDSRTEHYLNANGYRPDGIDPGYDYPGITPAWAVASSNGHVPPGVQPCACGILGGYPQPPGQSSPDSPDVPNNVLPFPTNPNPVPVDPIDIPAYVGWGFRWHFS